MPELPEVETTVRGLAKFLDGARIERVTLNRPDLRRPFPDDLVQVMTGDLMGNLDATLSRSTAPASRSTARSIT